MRSRASCAAASRSNFRSRVYPHRACPASNWQALLILRRKQPRQMRGVRARRTGNGPDHLRRSQPDAALVRHAARSAPTPGARLVRRKLSSGISGRDDAEISPGRGGKYLYPHGDQLLGHGGRNREPRADQRRIILRQQWRDLGGVGPYAVDRSYVAGRFQESASFPEHGTNLQAAGSLEGEARAWIHCGDAANDGAGETRRQGQLGFTERESFLEASLA